MFRFDFDVGDTDTANDARSDSIALQVQPSARIIVPVQCFSADDGLDRHAAAHSSIGFNGGWVFKQTQVDYRNLPKHQKELDTILERSDLVPDVYEGGFKLWECSIDLVQHLIDEDICLRSADVLDLGCGHGLPGIYAACHGAGFVSFQDLNVDVLRYVTAPNLALNVGLTSSCQLVAGDWRDPGLYAALAQAQYDFVFSCDTLYSLASQPALLCAIERCLRPGGAAYIAAKSFYFGIGGSTLSFLDLVDRSPTLKADVVKTFADGQSNVREILRITKVGSDSSETYSIPERRRS